MPGILRARTTTIDNGIGRSGILVAVPSAYPHDRSPWVHVAYSHTFVYSQRLIPTHDIRKKPPRGFEQLRQEILDCSSSPDASNEGLLGFHIVTTGGRSGPLPEELLEHRKVVIYLACFWLATVLSCLE